MLVRRDSDDIREIRPRAALGALIVVGAMLVLVVRLYSLQILRGDEFYQQSISNYQKSLPLPADRGLIKDKNGITLVENRPSFDVFLTPAYCKGKEKEAVMDRLATYLKLEGEDVVRMKRDYEKAWYSKDKLERFRPYLVQLDIPRDQVDTLEAHRSELSCVDLIPSPHRSYKFGASLGHVLGYMSEILPDELDSLTDDKGKPLYRRGQSIGRRGLERRWESALRGKDGEEKIAVDARGGKLDEEVSKLLIPESERLVPATPGNNLVLSLDARVQELADKSFPGRAGAVVVMEAKTGFILAMLSRPSFDPNKMSMRISRAELQAINEDPLKPMLNRVMNENYHPGSTFKVVTSLAGLLKGAITPTSHISCGGGYTMGNHRWRCDKPQGHGPLDLKQALQHSCDVFYYAVGDRVNLDAIADTARMLGYGKPTGLDLGREIPGIIPDSDSVTKTFGVYTKGHAINASIGQGEINVTPLQQAVAYAALGNGGTVFRPQIVRRIEDYEGKTLQDFKPIVERKLDARPQDLAAIQAGLYAVVNEPGGTGFRSKLDEPKFAGKTGTAQVVKLGGKQNLKTESQNYWSRDHAWFASYAPAVDPEIVVIVLNEHGGWGAEAAAPAASKIIAGWWELKKADAAAAAKARENQIPVAPIVPSSLPVAAAPLAPALPVNTAAVAAPAPSPAGKQ